MSSTPGDDLRARMAQLLDQELVERAGARVAAGAQAANAEAPKQARQAEPGIAERLSQDVWQIAAAALRLPADQLDPQENLANLGVDSIGITEIMVQISRHFGISVAPTTFFEARHLDDLSAILLDRYGKPIAGHYAKQAAKSPSPEPAEPQAEAAQKQDAMTSSGEDPAWQESFLRRHRAVTSRPVGVSAPQVRTETPQGSAQEAPIAILSMEGMFPQSPDLQAFEAHLAAGDDCIEEIPLERWDWRAVYGDPKKGAFTDVKYGGFVPNADRFDAGFFNISPREAELMDPQHRLFMECVWSLIEKGGYAPGSLAGKKVGLFLGINLLDYTDMVNRAGIMDAQQLTGLGHAFCPNRLSFLLDIHGPSEVVDTACSSSLVAIHRGVMSIRHEGCEMAIAGGSNLMLSPTQHIMFSKVGMITPDGRCKTFSKDANGYARADGVGAVLLKRLDLAERDGDPILGVIRGSVEHHGGGATSLTAPNPKAQGRLIAEAHRQAGVDPRTIGLIECHGTGTRLGDPIEIEGLKLAFQELYRDWGLEPPSEPGIGLGSVKSNIGHAETAAGVAGLIKVLLSMRSKTLYRTLHCAEPNPLLELSGSPFYLLQDAAPWQRPVFDGGEQPRRAGLSSFGAGGANVHLVIEEYSRPDKSVPSASKGPVVVPISAKTEEALAQAISRLRAAAGSADLADLAYTLQLGRDAMRHRVAFVAANREDLIRRMEAFLAGDNDVAVRGRVPPGRKEKAAPLDLLGKDATAVARHWTSGGDVDWQALYGADRPRRIALPGYPFQRKRYWLPEMAGTVGAARDTLAPAPAGSGKYQLSLTGKEVFLADHKVAGAPVLPGVAYLELARAAAAQDSLANPVLRQVVWMAPLRVERPVEVACEISRFGDGSARAEISSMGEGGERLLHAQMRIASEPLTSRRPVDLEALHQTPARHLDSSAVYAAFDGMGLIYGPGHRVITDLAIVSGREVLARLELPGALTATLSDFGLHPSLLDGALQSAIGLALDAEGDAPKAAALPFSIETVEIFGPCERRMWAHVRSDDASGSALRKMDIDLIADDGCIRVALRGFTTRALEPRSSGEAITQTTTRSSSEAGARTETPAILRFEPQWHPLVPAVAENPGRRIVLLAAGTGSAENLRSRLPDFHVRAMEDDHCAPLDQRYLHLADQLLKTGQAELSSGPLLIQLVLGGNKESAPLAGLVALFRSIAREHPRIGGQVLFLTGEHGPEDLAQLLQKASKAPAGALLKAEGEDLSVEIWDEVTSKPEPASVPWRSGGVYLITGGTGELGKRLAREILEKAHGATVVLASRSAPDARTAEWIADNPGLHHLRADFADETSVADLVAGIRRQHGTLDGVIHAAGVIQDEAFARKTPGQLAAVLAPKVTGALALDRAIGDAPLDFLVLYSSISGVFGNTGQADYAAANSFLDGFAEQREARRRSGERHGRTLSIAWPLWREGGMSLDEAQEDLMRRTTGLAPLETGAGLDALYSALNGSAARVLIAAGDAAKIRRFVGRSFEQQEASSPIPKQLAERKGADPAQLRRLVLASVTEAASAQLKVSEDDLDPDVELTEYGFDSIGFTQFANRLNDRFQLELTPTLFFEYPTLDGLAGYLSTEESAAMSGAMGGADVEIEPETDPEPPRPVTVSAEEPRAQSSAQPPRHPVPSQAQDDLVAVIGMSGQFPGAPDIDAFWEVLKEGRNCICEVPPERWDWRDYWGDPLSEPGKGNVKWGGFIEDIAAFDAAFFGVSAPEARMMDPQQRLLLTQSWRVMEDAGYAPSQLAGSKTGVFIGTADTGYSRLIAESGIKVEGYSMTGLAPSLGPNRISYFYDFHGPSVAVETACSSALIAVHRAVEAIRSGSCTAAIAGGINALLLPEAFVGFSKAGMLSPEGLCKPFSARADGYARGEGVGLVFLKPLRDAERDGDRIFGVIRASAENHGGHAASLTAPNPKAQAELIRTAYARSGIDPRTVGYIEAHGTGTPLGDPIEVEALTSAFADLSRDAEAAFGPAVAQSCAIGSVKSNIGHLELAAGIAGLIKVLLQMRHGEIVRSLHSEELNPYLKLKGSPFRVAQGHEAWSPLIDGDGNLLPRRAGVSSFGFGGTNAHVVLEEYPARKPAPAASAQSEPELIVLSAKSEAQLNEMAARFAAFLSEPDQAADLSDIGYTLQLAREPMEFRLAFSAKSRAEMLDRLKAFLGGESSNSILTGRVKANRKLNAVLEGDAPLREAAAGLAKRGRSEDLLALWAGGLAVDWVAVRKGRPGKRISLPGYPFAKTHYWVGTAPSAYAGKASGEPAALSLNVDGSESYLRDHRVHGLKVLPGVLSLELVRRALEGAGSGPTAFELIGHSWTGAITVEAGAELLEVSLKQGPGDGNPYSIAAQGAQGTRRHAEGVVRRLSGTGAPRTDLAAARSSAHREIDVPGLYRRFEALGLDYGPAQRAIAGLRAGDDIAVARLQLPAEADAGLKLHPSILDGALQAVFALNDAETDRLALPFSVRRVAVYGATLERMWAVVRRRDKGTVIDLCDDQGNVAVRLEDFVARAVAEPVEPQEAAAAFPVMLSEGERLERTLELVAGIAARTLEVDPASLDVDTELGDFGFDSVSMTAFASRMNAELGLTLTPADFFEFATLSRLAGHIAGDLTDEQLGCEGKPQPVAPAPAACPPVDRTVPEARSQSVAGEGDPIVIVGQSCCMPMAADAEEFWSNLISGRDCISRIPADRWSWRELDGDPRQEPAKTNIHWGGFIEEVFEFDPLFFGISPREARLMDPQQRLMLTHAWKAIEDAGHAPDSLAGRKVGVFVGTSSSGYRELIGEDTGGEGYVATGSVASVGPNRISYVLDLHGPSEPVETACSSSLVALHRAVQAIRAGDCDMALVGGVNTILTPEAHINFAKAGMLSLDGRCKTFSAAANGYVRGEGVGMLFVRKLSDAERDGDPILAVVRGTAINHGGHANSLTAPNTQAQSDLLVTAYQNADIDPRTIGYIEAHGTGTALGDPVEINALKSAFRSLPETKVRLVGEGCGLGSVKTNIGHLELAAGAAGVIKVLKQIEHRQLAPSLHCDEINPYIDLSGSPFEIVRDARSWTPVRDEHGAPLPLRAGVSSFGFGGVNAHAILEEYRPGAEKFPARPPSQGPVVVVLSARDKDRLRESARNLLAVLDSGHIDNADLVDLAYTLQVGRAELAERLAIVTTSLSDLRAQMASFLAGGETLQLFTGTAVGGRKSVGAIETGADPIEIARCWSEGGKVDWQSLNPGPHRRLRLPTYPFARDAYRVGKADQARSDDQEPGLSGDFRIGLDAKAFYLKDHVVRGSRILPGAMSLEIVCKAALQQNVAGPPQLVVSDVTWRRPVELNSGQMDLGVRFSKEGEGASRVRLVAEAGGPDFMRAVVGPVSDEDPPHLDLEALQRAFRTAHDPDWLYACYSAHGIDYGPSFRTIAELRTRDREVLARLRLPKVVEGGRDGFVLHPSLMDAAFHAALVAFADVGHVVLALPFGIDRLTVFAPTGPEMWAHLRVRGSSEGIRKLDIDLADENGRVAVRIEGFSLRLLQETAGKRTPDRPAALASNTAVEQAIERYFVDLIARETEVNASAISLTAPLEDYGIDSVLIMQLTDVLERDFGPLSKTLFFEYQTLSALIGYFRENHGARLAVITGAAPPSPVAAVPQQVADTLKRGAAIKDEPIAIIGLSGRYPGARTLDAFWRNLASGRDCVTEVPGNRWDHSRYFDPVRQAGKTTGRWGGFIDGHDRFDPMFFNIAPREAQYMDPQERLFLQTAWETLEDAGYTRASIAPAGDVGVFVGVMWEEYQLYGPEMTARGSPAALSGSAASIANRVSYFLNFHGPSIALDTMCSSSLTAIHLACDSLRAGSCSVALAGGVNLTVHPNKYVALSQGRFLSSKGRCESFGEGGDGYVPAEGVGAVLLKPLSRAEADGDRIHGVILGSALNHGGKTNGYTVPNPAAQTAVIEAALARAGVAPEEISYVEAHGTGTGLGDPIEIAALTKAYGTRGETSQTCAIGSVKSNIGHAESAAGMAGLTKLLLQLKHGQLVPSIHAERLNPNIDFAATPFRVQRSLAPWQRRSKGGQALPRIAGLSSFGAGGSNAHVVVAEYLEADRPLATSGPAVYPFSARDAERLRAVLQNLRSRLETLTDEDLPSVAYTLQEGREAFEEQLSIVAAAKAELTVKLDRVLAGETDVEGVFRARASANAAAVAPSSGLGDIAAGWVKGAKVDWPALRRGEKPRPLSLPTYPFAEELCWLPELEAADTTSTRDVPLPLLFAPLWQERPDSGTEPAQGRLHVVCDLASAYPQLADDLRSSGGDVTVLRVPQGAGDERYGLYALQLLEVLKDLVRQRQEKVVQVVVPFDGADGLLEGLSGLLRCAALEHPSLTCQLVAVDGQVEDLAARLRQDAGSAKMQADVRYRQGRRFVRAWRELAPAPDHSRSPWIENGVYLLTGGAGGVGLHVAEAIAASGTRPSLWLTGRSPLNADIEQRLQCLERQGAAARYRQVDITGKAAVSALLREIEATDGRLNGVFHGAGLTRDGLLVAKTEETFRQVLAPKVTGTRVLDEALGDRPLDFLVLFASVAGALGNPGQSDYATANAYLDSFASWRNAQASSGLRHGRTVSIDWPYWRDGGMQMDARTVAAMERGAGATPLETDAALAALNAILASGQEDQVLVLSGDPGRLRGLMKPADEPVRSDARKAEAAPAMVKRSEPVEAFNGRDTVVAAIKASFSKSLGIPEDRLGLDDTIDRFGVDSVSALEIVEVLEETFGPLPQTILFEFQTINRLADELIERVGTARTSEAEAAVPIAAAPGPVAQPEPVATASNQDIAIIAVAGRYPGADTIEAFAELLRQGRDCVSEVPKDRLDLLPRYSPRKGEPGASYCKWGAFLSGVDRFDADFFGYSRRAADLADPQERLFLETAWHLFERAGHTRAFLAEHYDKRVGVFVGAMYNQYPGLASDPEDRALLALSSYSGIANRTSFFFDLQGPSVAVDSMCSSGLQAVHQACQSLRSGECRLAVAGGVNLSIHPAKYEGLSRAGLVGSDPEARAFAGGDGYLPAEGVGAVLLKPLRDALADGDRVLAVIKGSLANHAGHSAGYAVPNVDAQVRLLEDGFRMAGIDPETISYVEAAATGSQIGDAIELRALSRVFARPERGRIAIGSVKTNMGHAEAASGLAQLTKVLLQFEHRELFPSFVKGGGPQVFEGTPFKPQTVLAPWQGPVMDGYPAPRRAAISSFGAGGSNVHLILQEAPIAERPGGFVETGRPLLFPVSARIEEQLMQLRSALANHLRGAEGLCLQALSWTLRHGRESFDCKITIAASSAAELIRKLEDPDLEERGDGLETAGGEEDACAGPMLVLPGYPFKRERHWLKQAAAADPRTAAPEAIERPVLPASEPEAEETALRFISRTLALELGCMPGDIGSDVDFERLGVDSMARMRLVYAIEEGYGVVLTQQDLDAHPTPKLLAGFIETRAPDGNPAGREERPDVGFGPYRLPLGEAQKGLWVLQSLYPQSGNYNVPLGFRCRAIDIAALAKAVDWLVSQYPVLATRVVLEDDQPVLTTRPGPVEVVSVSLPKDCDLQSVLRQRAAIPFDLEKGVFRVEHASGSGLDDGESVVLLTAHHIVTDGVSCAVMTREFWRSYGAFCKSGHPDGREDTSADYAEFVAWETNYSTSEQGQAQKHYWLDKLSGPLPELRLPVEASMPREADQPGESLDLRLSADLSKAVADTAKSSGVSPASLYLTAFAALFYRYTGEQDLVIGIPTLRRPSKRFAETLGYCANMIALRLGVDPGLSPGDLSRQVHAELGEGLARSDYPFTGIARELGGTATGATPYQVTFAYQSFGADAAGLDCFASGNVRLIEDLRQTGDTLLGIEVQNDPKGALIIANYTANSFARNTMERMLRHYRQLLEALVEQDEVSIAAAPLLTSAEIDRALHHWSRTRRADVSGTPVHELVFAQAARTPTATAVSRGSERTSYKRLAARSRQIALTLEKRGLRRGGRVAVLLGREADSVAALLAVFAIGAVWVPLDPDYPDDRLAYILKDAGVGAILTKGAELSRLQNVSGLAATVIDLDRERQGLRGRFARFAPVEVHAQDPAYIIYTSGSTGSPKGVVVSHGALSGHCEVISREYGLSAEDVVLQFAPASVDTAIEQILPVLTVGGRLELRPDSLQTSEAFLKFLGDKGVTVADLPPVYLHEVLRSWESGRPDTSGLALRLVIVGGEALPPEVVDLWSRSRLAGRRLINAYGPTEATITALTHAVKANGRERNIPIGRPLPGMEVYILDRDGNLMPDGVIGELHLGGDRLAIGYHDRPELTQAKFREHAIGGRNLRLYSTGDLACFRANSGGLVEFHGRIDDQVKIRGHRIELGEVEAAIAACGITEVAVLLEKNRSGDPLLTAYLGVKEKSFDELNVKRRVAVSLPAHMVPSVWICLDRLPKTVSGKIDRRALKDTSQVAPRVSQNAQPPRDLLEERLLDIWKGVLGRSAQDRTLGIEDDFTDAGGHSLLAVRLLSRIEQAFGRGLSVTDLARADTISAQAQLLRERGVTSSIAAQGEQSDVPLVVSLRQPDFHSTSPNGEPLFLIHPIGGTLTCYQPLVEALTINAPVYGIRAEGLEPGEDCRVDSIEEMATRYSRQIRQVQANGPYRLGGWSLGGVIAYEIARQLIEAGEAVTFLGLIDSYLPEDIERLESPSGQAEDDIDRRCKQAFVRDLFGADVELATDQDVVELVRGLPQCKAVLAACYVEDVRRLFDVFAANYRLFLTYQPRACHAPLTLVRATEGLEQDFADFWSRLSTAPLTVHRVAADHYSVLRMPGLSEWAGAIAATLSDNTYQAGMEQGSFDIDLNP